MFDRIAPTSWPVIIQSGGLRVTSCQSSTCWLRLLQCKMHRACMLSYIFDLLHKRSSLSLRGSILGFPNTLALKKDEFMIYSFFADVVKNTQLLWHTQRMNNFDRSGSVIRTIIQIWIVHNTLWPLHQTTLTNFHNKLWRLCILTLSSSSLSYYFILNLIHLYVR